MEDLSNRVDHLDLIIDLGVLIANEKGSFELVIVAQLMSQWQVKLEALLRVHSKIWTKNGGLDIKVLDRCTFVFYFEELAEMNQATRKAPWSFDNDLLVMQCLLGKYMLFWV